MATLMLLTCNNIEGVPLYVESIAEWIQYTKIRRDFHVNIYLI